jgi:hypothetical protein
MNIRDWFRDMLDRTVSRFEGRQETRSRLDHDRDHLVVHWTTSGNETGENACRWEEVVSATAFRVEQTTLDCICIALQPGHSYPVTVNEEMEGWLGLVEKMPDYLPGFPPYPEWRGKVAAPDGGAGSGETILYKREERSGPAPFTPQT